MENILSHQAKLRNCILHATTRGESANSLNLTSLQSKQLAAKLAHFLKELHKIDITNAPLGGLHNYHRGAHLSVYDHETRSSIAQLNNLIKVDKATSVWEKAIRSTWRNPPVWIHGDFASSNILIKNGALAAVIDFGCMGIGDPACDLAIAWTFFKGETQKTFKDQLSLDPDTWARGKGWVLWKTGVELVKILDKTSPEAVKKLSIINSLILRE